MPTINLKQDLYDELHNIMGIEVKERLKKSSNPKEDMIQIAQNKFGITFDGMIRKLLEEYKNHNKIR